MDIKEIKEQLRNQRVGNQHYVKYTGLAPIAIDTILQDLGFENEIGEDWNGVDLDYSADFTFDDNEYHAWGSAYFGTLLIERRT